MSGIALPGLDGFGAAATTGGANGTVYNVISLADTGVGTLRAACEASGTRIVRFSLAGFITLDSPIQITNPFLTIDGFSAPGSGITVRCRLTSTTGLNSHSYGIFEITTHDVIIQGIALRPGIWASVGACTAYQALGANTCADPQDQIIIYSNGASKLVFDHLSLSHQTDLWFNLEDTTDVTISYCIGAYGYRSYPYMGFGATDDPGRGKGLQNYGSTSTRFSAHHNLWAHASSRMPQWSSGLVDDRYTVVYNWGGGAVGYLPFGLHIDNIFGVTHANVVGTEFIAGPTTPVNTEKQCMVTDWRGEPEGASAGDLGVFFSGLSVTPFMSLGKVLSTILTTEWSCPAITPNGGTTSVYSQAGAMWYRGPNGTYYPRRDNIDTQVVYEVLSQTGRAPLVDELPTWGAVYQVLSLDGDLDISPSTRIASRLGTARIYSISAGQRPPLSSEILKGPQVARPSIPPGHKWRGV